jgi:hypothetical protein
MNLSSASMIMPLIGIDDRQRTADGLQDRKAGVTLHLSHRERSARSAG